MWSYELGAKTEWDGRFGYFVVNTALFYLDYSDKQTNTQQEFGACDTATPPPECLDGDPSNDGLIFLLGVPTNASAASVTGWELETSWATPLDGLSLGFGMTLLDSEYEDFVDATRSATRIAIAGNCDDIVVIRGSDHCNLNLSGNQLEYMPKRSYVVTGRYEVPLAATGLDWFIESNGSYQSERYTSADNFTELDEFWKVDARIGLMGDSWDLIAYVNNLFDDNTISSNSGAVDVAAGYVNAANLSGNLAPPTLAAAFLPQPRTYGLRLLYQF